MIANTYLKLKLLKRKIPFKALNPYKSTRKVEDFQKLSNIEIYFILQSNCTKWYKKPFIFISLPNFIKGNYILSQESFDGYMFCLVYTYLSLSPSLKPCNT